MPHAFRNLRIGHRLALAFTAIVLLMLGITAVGEAGMARVEDRLRLINDDYAAKVFLATELMDVVNQQARSTRNLLILDDTATLADERRRIDDTRGKAGELFGRLDKLTDTDQERTALADVVARRAEYAHELDAFLRQHDDHHRDEARALMATRLRERQLDYMRSLQAFVDARKQEMATAGHEAYDLMDQVTRIMLAAAVAGVVIAAVAGWLTARSITRPIGRAVALAERVAAGDLTCRIDVDRGDETGALLQALRTMNENLVALVADVRRSSDSIATGSSQVAVGSVDLSQRTEEQAANLEQTAAAMEQLTATARTSADTAAQASQLAQAASTSAARGGDAVGEVVDTMQRISASSRRIAEITGVIDGIAFQTNILALNAAVEAARAGEQGRGFAVVAGEVRSLAQRSAQAAREIRQLIAGSVETVDDGARKADSAGRSIQDLVAQVRRVTDLIGEIGAAAHEQTQGIDQINDAVSQLDQVTQHNAALVEESTAAAESLREQAERLVAAVSRFRVEEARA